jgi:hypothetical protein
MNLRYWFVLYLVGTAVLPGAAQDSVDVTFRFSRAGVSGVTLVGEFNGGDNTA